jgi:hypothetical protein
MSLFNLFFLCESNVEFLISCINYAFFSLINKSCVSEDTSSITCLVTSERGQCWNFANCSHIR